jgi:hypothetical protein
MLLERRRRSAAFKPYLETLRRSDGRRCQASIRRTPEQVLGYLARCTDRANHVSFWKAFAKTASTKRQH